MMETRFDSMTAKEKAQELLDTMTKQTYKYQEYAGANYTTCEIGYEGGKKCALIAVDELIESHLLLTTTHEPEPSIRCKRYWQQVKQEIEKL